MFFLGFTDPQALRPVLGDPFYERTEARRGSRIVGASRGQLPATTCVKPARFLHTHTGLVITPSLPDGSPVRAKSPRSKRSRARSPCVARKAKHRRCC